MTSYAEAMRHLKHLGAIAVTAGVVVASLVVPAYGQEALDPAAKAAAASAYLSIVCPTNAARDRLGAAIAKAERAGMKEGSAIPKYVVKALRQYSNSSGRSGRQILAYQWPDSDLRFAADSMATDNYEAASRAGSVADDKKWRNPWTRMSEFYPARMRLSLGLPPAGQGCPKR